MDDNLHIDVAAPDNKIVVGGVHPHASCVEAGTTQTVRADIVLDQVAAWQHV